MKLGSNILCPQSFKYKDPNMEESGIIEMKRFIYLFFDSNDIIDDKNNILNPAGTTILGKAIQVNMCLVEGGRENIDIMPYLRGGRNSTYMVINMYTYDTRFDQSIRNINSAEFTLINSVAASSTNDYDLKRCITNGISLYSKEFRGDENKQYKLSDGDSLAPGIPEPLYYTLRQQESEMNDIYTIQALTSVIVHYGFELIDNETQVAIMDKSLMDTMNIQLRDKMKEIKYMVRSGSQFNDINMYDTTQLSSEMMYNILESLQSGYIYTYDSDLGRNITTTSKSFLPFAKYRMKDEMITNMQRAIDTVELHAKDLEKQHGHLRITFTPCYRGDKIDVYFKDYAPDHQPVIKNNSQIDSGEKINEEIDERLRDLDDNSEDDLNEFTGNCYTETNY